jgi:DNA-binding LytR/AlgR family response regulator
MKRVFIVEDEFDIAENIEDLLIHFGYEVVGIEGDGEVACSKISNLNPDLVIIDILLKGMMDGIELAKKMREKSKVPIIFISCYFDYQKLERIAELNYDSFLLKPFTKDALYTAVNLAFLKSKKPKEDVNILKIRDKGFLVPLNENDIIMLKADGLYTKIYTTSKQYVVRDIIKDVIGKLSDKKFIRVHKSYLINLDFISSFNAKEVNMGSHVVPIRRGFYKELGELIVDRLGS